MFTQVERMFQQVLSAVAQVLSVPADVLHGLAVAAANGMTDFLSATGRQKQSRPCADSNTRDQKSKVLNPAFVISAHVFFSCRLFEPYSHRSCLFPLLWCVPEAN
jgi:hypothetical protein